jgi:CheY-like chemotaxis protein
MLTKILVVEDEVITAMDLKNTLKMFGFEVVSTASSGQEAIQKAGELKPDLILMDIILKDKMDGIEATERIQALFDIPVIYLTAYGDDETFERAKLTKPYGFLTKPVNHDGLKAAIETALYKHNLDKQLIESEEQYHNLFKNNHSYSLIF